MALEDSAEVGYKEDWQPLVGSALRTLTELSTPCCSVASRTK